MDSRAHVDQAVFDFIRPRLKRYRGDAYNLTRRVTSVITQASNRADSVVFDRRMEVDRAHSELEACLRQKQKNVDCSEYRRRLDRCEYRLQEAIRGRDLIRIKTSSFGGVQAAYVRALDELLLRAEKIVMVADERTSNYQHVPQEFSMPEAVGLDDFAELRTVSWQELPGVSVPGHFPAGFALIPIELIVSDNAVSAAEDLDAGHESPALRWSTEALLDVVLPTMSSMTDVVQYLGDRDARESRVGDCTYSATYSRFFSPDSAIRLSPLSNGMFDLVSGGHEVRLMRRTGAECVPALIGGATT